MDTIEQRARELLAAEYGASTVLGDNHPALRAVIAALRQQQVAPGAVDEQTNEWPNLATAKRAAYYWSNEAWELRRKLDAAIASNHAPQPVVDDVAAERLCAFLDAVGCGWISRETARAALEEAVGRKP